MEGEYPKDEVENDEENFDDEIREEEIEEKGGEDPPNYLTGGRRFRIIPRWIRKIYYRYTTFLLFIGIYSAIIGLLLYYIQTKLKDVKTLWFMGGHSIPYETYVESTIKRIAQMNELNCKKETPYTKYCHPLPVEIPKLPIPSGPSPDASSNKPEDTYNINQTLPSYVAGRLYAIDQTVDLRKYTDANYAQLLQMDICGNLDTSGNRDLSGVFDASFNTNAIGRFPEKIKMLEKEGWYIFSFLIHLAKMIHDKSPKVVQPYIYPILIIILLLLVYQLLAFLSIPFQTPKKVRILRIWEDRWGFGFWFIFFLYLAIAAIVFILLKHHASLRNPMKYPFLSTFFNKNNFNRMRDVKSSIISSVRLHTRLEGFQSEKAFDDIQEKLIGIQSTRNTPTFADSIDSAFENGIDTIRKSIQSLIFQTYLSNKNTIKRVVNPSPM